MAADHLRISRVRLRNYRSIESCGVALSDLTLLVGPNGSGKSNFLDAITFLREGSVSIRDAVRRGGMRDVSFQGGGESSIGLTLRDVFPDGIEEPAGSLHPAAARVHLDALKESSPGRKVIASTHSPDLLDRSTVRPEEIMAFRYLRGRSYVGSLDEVIYRPKEHQPAFSSLLAPELAFVESRSFRRMCAAIEALAGSTS